MNDDREAFEAWISASPYERSITRYTELSAWPGSYVQVATDLAWQAWQAAIEHAKKTMSNRN